MRAQNKTEEKIKKNYQNNTHGNNYFVVRVDTIEIEFKFNGMYKYYHLTRFEEPELFFCHDFSPGIHSNYINIYYVNK
jgi:hypothetical protein